MCPRKAAGRLQLNFSTKICFTWYTYINDKINLYDIWDRADIYIETTKIINQVYLSHAIIQNTIIMKCNPAFSFASRWRPGSSRSRGKSLLCGWLGSLMILLALRGRRREARDLREELCRASLLKNRSICVSSTVALAGLSDTITEESVSCDSAEETPQGLEF